MLLAELLKIDELLLGLFVLAARLREHDFGGVEVTTGNGTLIKKILARVEDFFLCVVGGFGRCGVELGLLNLFREARAGRRGVSGLGLFEFALTLLSRALEVGVLENREDLSLFDVATTLHVELADGGSDFWCDHGLLERRNDSFGRYGLLNGAALRRYYLDGNDGFRLFLPAAASVKQRCRSEQERGGSPRPKRSAEGTK